MKKLFIYRPQFRILSPIFTGVIVYLLILLINNNVEQLQEEFLGQELYVCIGLSYLIQELSIFLLWIFKKYVATKVPDSLLLLINTLISLVLCIFFVSLSMTLYYRYVLGFSPNSEELWLFNSIFSSIALIYILLYVSHQYLHKMNSKKLENELLIKGNVEANFLKFKKAINPDLLFECLEALIVLIGKDKEKIDDFLDGISQVYRHVLSKSDQELISIKEEATVVEHLIKVFDYLPYRNVTLKNKLVSDFYVVPNSIILIVEQIIRSTIRSKDIELEIELYEEESSLYIRYLPKNKINDELHLEKFAELRDLYSIYNSESLHVFEENSFRMISLPKILLNPAYENSSY